MTASNTAGTTSQLADGSAAGRWVLDPARSTTEFHVKHFWGALTVHGTLGTMSGEAVVGPDGTVTGRIEYDVRALDTKHKKRDDHLRSADFFHTDEHPHAVLTVASAHPAGPDALQCQGTLELAGHTRPLTFTAQVRVADGQEIELAVELQVDRSEFGMGWSPLKMTAMTTLGTVTARFTRA